MQISFEGKLGLILGLIALAGGGAMMVAPGKLWIGWSLIGIACMGAVGLGFHHVGRRFLIIFLVAGLLCFDYWYYSSVPVALTIAPTQPMVEPSTGPSPVPVITSPKPAKPNLFSTMARVILICDSQSPQTL